MITCYLDSQDYSILTDPKASDTAHGKTRQALLELSHSGRVVFAFSVITVSEAVSLTPQASHLAELKADFLGDLCNSNALLSLDRLVETEVTALTSQSGKPPTMFDSEGRWFPLMPVDTSPSIGMSQPLQISDEDINTLGLSRFQKRAASRKLIKRGKPRATLKAQLDRQDSLAIACELIKQYPMRPEDAGVVSEYMLGRASEADFNAALSGSLKDPRFMMKWFTTQHAMSSSISEIVRQPGRELGELMRTLVDISLSLANSFLAIGREGEISRMWSQTQDGQLIGVASQVAQKMNISKTLNATAQEVDVHAPGLSACVRSLYSSVWDNVHGNRRELPSNSQPVDALHACYAPYVDVFRADRYMAPHIQRQVERHGTVVVPRLSQLVEVLESQLKYEARSGN